jgi:hypothetical protein
LWIKNESEGAILRHADNNNLEDIGKKCAWSNPFLDVNDLDLRHFESVRPNTLTLGLLRRMISQFSVDDK